MKRRILVGASWKLGIKSSPESPDCFWKRIAECRHCKNHQGSFPSLMGDRKFLQNRRELTCLTRIKLFYFLHKIILFSLYPFSLHVFFLFNSCFMSFSFSILVSCPFPFQFLFHVFFLFNSLFHVLFHFSHNNVPFSPFLPLFNLSSAFLGA